MPDICVATTPATCGHIQTGSLIVKIEGKGVCRVNTDSAGGLITGLGSQKVFVQGNKVSLPGDAIDSHYPCPTPDSHCNATTVAGQERVTAG
jgi:uncharacterized Zn-binding protein involved in type VI secretion